MYNTQLYLNKRVSVQPVALIMTLAGQLVILALRTRHTHAVSTSTLKSYVCKHYTLQGIGRAGKLGSEIHVLKGHLTFTFPNLILVLSLLHVCEHLCEF